MNVGKLTSSIVESLEDVIPGLVATELGSFDFESIVVDAVTDVLNDWELDTVINDLIPSLDVPTVSTFSSNILDQLYSDGKFEDLIDWVMGIISGRMQNLGIITIPVTPFLEVGLAFNPESTSWNTWLTTNDPVKPFLWLSQSMNKVFTWVGEAVEDLVDDLPHPLIMAIPYYRNAWKIVDADGEVATWTIPDFNFTIQYWQWTIHLIKIGFRAKVPTWKDEDIAGSENWYYLVDGVYDTGVVLGQTTTWGELFSMIGIMLALGLVVRALFKSGYGEVATGVVTRAVNSASMTNLKTSLKAVKDLVGENANLIRAVGYVATAVDKIDDVFDDKTVQQWVTQLNANDGSLGIILSKLEEILSRIGLRLSFS